MPSIREILRNLEAEKFNREVAAKLIKLYLPNAVVKVNEERKGIPKPDILVAIDNMSIPIEVKRRTHLGYFYIVEQRGTTRKGTKKIPYTVCFKDQTKLVSYKNRTLFERTNFAWQVKAMLRDHGACLFLVNANVQPFTPFYRRTVYGPLVLSNFKTLEKSLDLSLDLAHDYLQQNGWRL